MTTASFRLGAARVSDDAWSFCVWAPKAKRVELHLLDPADRLVELQRDERGYFSAEIGDVAASQRYMYRLDGQLERPDPASRAQPDGVHGPSRTVDLSFPWTDQDHRGLPLEDYVIYELHVGCFDRAGSFEAVAADLPRLRDLGVTAIELMPVAQFPGERNWGYDGVYPFAVQHSYGGARGLQSLCDACHRHGMCVVLDVVYNHLGPEGNYLRDFAPYFTEVYRTPWGAALNFDDRGSDEVRRYFVDNALQWVEDFHIDALRLDAVHAIVDRSARPFLEELATAVHESAQRSGRIVQVIAESDLNDPKLVRSSDRGGYGLDSMWSDDFHHSLHALLTGERQGYYADFGQVADLAEALRHGMSYTGQRSRFRGRRHGRPGPDLAPSHFVVAAQNHDQVGNRMLGERLGALSTLEQQKLAAACVLLSPQLPLLFMGEEYGERAPFLYFTSHGDPGLAEAVRRGRRAEFRSFSWRGEAPDPQAQETFDRSRLDRTSRAHAPHAQLEHFYKTLLTLRRELDRGPLETTADEAQAVMQAWSRDRSATNARWLICAFGSEPTRVTLTPPFPDTVLCKQLCSADPEFGGGGAELPDRITTDVELELPAHSCALYSSRAPS